MRYCSYSCIYWINPYDGQGGIVRQRGSILRYRITTIIGTRPEAIKMAPVVLALRNSGLFKSDLIATGHNTGFTSATMALATGQHLELFDEALPPFALAPDHRLDFTLKGCTPEIMAEAIGSSLIPLLEMLSPHLVLVQGDTSSAFAAACTADSLGIPVGHVEAGLRSGDMQLFKKLQVGEESVVYHKLQNSPLVDLYQLDYFLVVASEDDYKYLTWVNFFLYHSSEKRIRFVPEGQNAPVSVEIEPTDDEPYRVSFADMLARYKVEYTDNSSLDDIEHELWDAIFAAPNDRFDDQQYAHSPWFDRCCRDQRSVKTLKQKGDWDDMWIKFVPRKTENYVRVGGDDLDLPTPAPTMIQVSHFSFNKLGLTLLSEPVYAQAVINGLRLEGRDLEAIQRELKLMVLLRA